MRSRTISRFWKLFAALPEAVRQQAYQAYEHFTSDPFYPSLSFKEVNPRVGLWSARINDDYRVLAIERAMRSNGFGLASTMSTQS